MEISLHRECPSIDHWIFRVCEHGHSGILTAVADQLEDQWDRLIPSDIAGNRVMGKSEGSNTLSGAVSQIRCRNITTTPRWKKLMPGHTT